MKKATPDLAAIKRHTAEQLKKLRQLEEIEAAAFWKTGTAVVANAPETNTSLSYKDIKEAMDKIKAIKDPIAEYMRQQGFDPDEGGEMMLPPSWRVLFGDGNPPPYVEFSSFYSVPILVNRRKLKEQLLKDLEPPIKIKIDPS